tara:strand:+ start:902 stop:1921 length:1020 start_codon:yes stop_codon:yes gene_type:complete
MNNKAFNQSLKDNRYPIIPTAWCLFTTLLLFVLSNTVSIYFYYLAVPVLILTIYICYLCYGQIKNSYDGNAKKEDFLEDGENTTYYSNKNKKQIVNLKNGLRHGHFISFHENGNKSCECEYDLGKKHGSFTSFHYNGNIEFKTFYKDGVQNGETVSFYDNGNLFREFNLIDGECIGDVKEYFKNGNVKFSLIDGIHSFYDESKVMRCKAEFSQPIEAKYESQDSYADNFKGVWSNFRKDGSLEYQLDFDDSISDNDLSNEINSVLKTVYTKGGEIFMKKSYSYVEKEDSEINFLGNYAYQRKNKSAYTHTMIVKGPPGAYNMPIPFKTIDSLEDIIELQ